MQRKEVKSSFGRCFSFFRLWIRRTPSSVDGECQWLYFFSERIWNEYVIRLPVSSPYNIARWRANFIGTQNSTKLFYFILTSLPFNVFDSAIFFFSLSVVFDLLIFLLVVQNKSIIFYTLLCCVNRLCASWFFGLTAHLFLSKRRRLNVKWRIRMANDFYACVHVYNEWDRKVAFSSLVFCGSSMLEMTVLVCQTACVSL